MTYACDCSCDYDGPYDGPKVYHEAQPIARKEHRCCECGGIIKVGERYERVEGLWDDVWATFKTCLPCVRIRNEFCPTGFVFEELRETLYACLGFDYVRGDDADDD